MYYNFTRLIPILFQLFRLKDKELRKTMYLHICAHLRRLSMKSQNKKILKWVQQFLFKILKDTDVMIVKKSMDIIIYMF